jgi:hypothetical protein
MFARAAGIGESSLEIPAGMVQKQAPSASKTSLRLKFLLFDEERETGRRRGEVEYRLTVIA